MKRKNRFYILIAYVVFTSTLIAAAGPQAPDQEEYNIIDDITHEMRIFRDALKAAKRCMQKKECSPADKQAMSRAVKHGVVIAGLLALLTGATVYAVHKKRLGRASTMSYAERSNARARVAFDLINSRWSDAEQAIRSSSFNQEDLNAILTSVVIGSQSEEGVRSAIQYGGSARKITPDVDRVSLLGTALSNVRRDNELKARILEVLVKNGAPIDHINFPSTKRTTVLMEAAAQNNLPVVEKLLALGANKALVDAAGMTAYDHAVQANASDEIKEILSIGTETQRRAFGDVD